MQLRVGVNLISGLLYAALRVRNITKEIRIPINHGLKHVQPNPRTCFLPHHLQSMPCSLVSSKRAIRAISCLSRDPSPVSRIGDIGYIDLKGSWHCVVNIFDPQSCAAARIKELVLAEQIPHYISETKCRPFDRPIIHLLGGGSFTLASSDTLDQ